MSVLDVFRSTVGAAALGFARRALDEAARRALKRPMFGKTLADFQLTQAKLADMAICCNRCGGAADLPRRLGEGHCRRTGHPRGVDG